MRTVSFCAGLALALSLVLHASLAGAADWRDQGARSLIVGYRTTPSARAGFRAALRTTTLPMLERLKASGDLESYHLLANRYVDSGVWDTLMILDFKDSKALARWRSVEASQPAGLSPGALQLVSSVETAPSDLLFERAVAANATALKSAASAPVYLVVPYDYLVSEDSYLAYVKGYLLPQVDGWIEAGALSGYDVYLPRYPAGREWSALLVLAYRGDEGLARRDAVVKAVRERLAATSPGWKAFADTKQSIRNEKVPMVADDLASATR